MMFLSKLSLALATASFLVSSTVNAKAVFCHYLIGTVTDGSGHAELDIDQAQAMGFDAFALNIGAPTEPFTADTLTQLFNHAASTGFKLFFSLDISAHSNIQDFVPLMQQYFGNQAYYTYGSNNYPFLSTFSAGGSSPSDWANLRNQFDNKVYFVPNFDNAQGYWDDTNGWFSAWDAEIGGTFSWESAWPLAMDNPTNVSTDTSGHSDQYVMGGAKTNNKSYMIGLSSLQYKHFQGNIYYRVGEVNLPQRMGEILQLGKSGDTYSPDFVEVITWNDAGEGHYIGNIWSEGLPQEILDYANQDDWPHSGWQSLVTSFIAAYKAGDDATAMALPSGSQAVGAMWYRTILKDATCANDQPKPTGWQAAQDAVNYAVVLPSGGGGMSIRTTSGGNVLQTVAGQGGLNYGSVGGMATGAQKVEMVDGSGNVVLSAESVKDVTADTDGICNFNYQVAALK